MNCGSENDQELRMIERADQAGSVGTSRQASRAMLGPMDGAHAQSRTLVALFDSAVSGPATAQPPTVAHAKRDLDQTGGAVIRALPASPFGPHVPNMTPWLHGLA